MRAMAAEGAMVRGITHYVYMLMLYVLATAGLVGGWGALMILANWLIGGDYGQYR
jgi:hypothetical protein